MHLALVKFVQNSNEMEINYGFNFLVFRNIFFDEYFFFKMGFLMLKNRNWEKKCSVHSDLHINLELAVLKLISSKSKGTNLIISNHISFNNRRRVTLENIMI